MGTMANRDYVTSIDETRNTKKHIARLEIELKNALALLEQTERRIIDIKRDLEEHKLLAAPIRRVPFEILSYIFATCCIDGVLTAVRISVVCHRWRSTILATPVAWSRVSDRIPSEIMSIVLERSGTRLLHVKSRMLCSDCQRPLTATSKPSCHCGTLVKFLQPQILQRIECLHTSDTWMRRLNSSVNIFSTVRHLSLDGGSWASISIAPLNTTQFPALRSLDISNGALDSAAMKLPLVLPPLEELKCQADILGSWVTLLQKCAKTLKRLNIRGIFREHGATTAVVQFPILESLVIKNWTQNSGTQLLQAITPSLTCYSYDDANRITNMVHHEDVANVVHLRTTTNFDLSRYTRLRILQVEGRDGVTTIFDQLERSPNWCPSLEVIQIQGTTWIGDRDVEYCKRVLQLRNEQTKSNIQFIQDDVWHHPIPVCDGEACVSVHSAFSS
jgi:hypothetical protein